MSKITKRLILTGSLILGYHLGGNLVNNNTKTTQYELVKKENTTYLNSKETQEKHPLRKINNETYMGTLEHLVNGVKELSYKRKIDNINKGDAYE